MLRVTLRPAAGPAENVSKATGASVGWKADATGRAFQRVLNVGPVLVNRNWCEPDMKGTALSRNDAVEIEKTS
jgi:hypothetical protein